MLARGCAWGGQGPFVLTACRGQKLQQTVQHPQRRHVWRAGRERGGRRTQLESKYMVKHLSHYLQKGFPIFILKPCGVFVSFWLCRKNEPFLCSGWALLCRLCRVGLKDAHESSPAWACCSWLCDTLQTCPCQGAAAPKQLWQQPGLGLCLQPLPLLLENGD